MLTYADPLTRRPTRVLVAGVTGTGKTTLAARIALVVGSVHIEIDALWWGPMWTPRDEFLDEVTGFVDTKTWITEWQYPPAKPLLAERADLLIWLDLPFRVSLTRLIRRTFRRRIRREEIWNANVEPPLWTFFTSQDHIVRWAIRTRSQYKAQVPELERTHRDLVIVRLRSQREVDAWVLGPLVDSLQAADR